MTTFRSMPARFRAHPIAAQDLAPGDYSIYAEDGDTAMIIYRPPGADYAYSAHLTTDKAKADKQGTAGRYWWWNGDKLRPTCLPSFGVGGETEQTYTWHGHLTEGQWVAV